MNIGILIPIYRTMDAACVQSLLDIHCQLYACGHHVKFYFANGFNAARARLGLARTVCEDKEFNADYFLWLDSDHIYPKAAFDELVKVIEEKGLSMLSANYKMHGSEESVHGITEDGKFRHFHYKDLNALPDGELVECHVVGFGFLVMKAEFLKGMWAKHGENLFKMDIGMNGTEDVAFCQCAISDGHKILFHPKLRVGHLETAVRI